MVEFRDFMSPWSQWGGKLRFRYDVTEIAASGETTLLSINGQGQILSGLIYPDPGTSRVSDSIRVRSDGTSIGYWNFTILNLFNIRSIHEACIYLTTFNAVSHHYCVGFSPFITFDETFSISVTNGHATKMTYYTNLTYSLIKEY